jgi:hypothetical protein
MRGVWVDGDMPTEKIMVGGQEVETLSPVGAEGMHHRVSGRGYGSVSDQSNEQRVASKGSADRGPCDLRLFIPDSQQTADPKSGGPRYPA